MPPSLKAAAMAISAAQTGEAVKVVVRCRPMNKKEKEDSRTKIVKVVPEKGTVAIQDPANPGDDPKTFTFDACYDWDCKQRDVYDETAHPLIEEVLNGFNGTIFAYGQTGCGKSFTMMGLPEPPEMRGIIPNAFVHIFNHISVTTDKEFLIRASFIEIYNEEVRDLLGKDPEKKLDLKEDPEKGVYVKDLTAVVVKDYAEIDEVMKLGNTHRTVGATAMNADSSRSHSLFTVVIEMSEPVVNPENGETETKIKAGKLNLVDLAGSERQSKTQAEGARLKEATKINLSLSALGNVITAIASGKKGHIPYRDSKLTRLLQSSLGGNTKTVMCANIGPADYNYDETMSTLRYANRAKNIKNKPKINEDPKDALLRQFQEEIARLQSMLEGGGGGAAAGGGDGAAHGGVDLEQLQRMKAETEKAETEKAQMMELLEKERAEREAIDAQLAALKAKLVGGVGVGDVSAPLLEGPASPAKEEATLATPGKPEQTQAGSADMTPSQSQRQMEVHEAQRAQAKEEEQLYIDDEKFASLQEEVEEKTRKLEKLRKKLKASQKEVQDLQSEFQVERDDFLETIRGAERELKLFTAIAKRHVSADLLSMYEEQSTWDDDTEEWRLPKAPRGMEVAGGRSKSSSKSKRTKATADRPPTDIGKASPTSAEDAEYANDIMGGSDEDYGRASRSGSSSSAMNRSGGPRQFDDADTEGGKYFTDAADRERNNAGRRVLADATAMKNEMLSNLVLWGAEDVKLTGAKKKGSDLPARRIPNRVGGLPLNATGALPIPNIAGKANTFVDVLADQRAESAVAKDMERFNQQQALGRPKPMSDADELAFVKELAGAGGGGGKMTL